MRALDYLVLDFRKLCQQQHAFPIVAFTCFLMTLTTPCHKSWVCASNVHACVQLCPGLPSPCMDTQETIGTFPKGCRRVLGQ